MINYLRSIIGEKSPIRFVYYWLKSFISALIYGFPGQKIKVIGVTGTDGKTTTVNLITHLLNQADIKTGMVSTTTFAIGREMFSNKTKRTSVSPFLMNKLLRRMVNQKCEYVVLEVSSHALEQKRFLGVDFDIAVLTNITPEHLDYHNNMQEYRRVKSLLFQKLGQSKMKIGQPKTMVLNKADPVFDEFLDFFADQKFSYALKEGADFWASEIDLQADKSVFQLDVTESACRQLKQSVQCRQEHSSEDSCDNSSVACSTKIELPLVGEFNIENALAASAVVMSVGLNLEQIQEIFKTFGGVGGRMEKIEAGQDFNVIVDFALTPVALKKLFQTAKSFTKGRVIGVFGCTGDRDQTKRPVTGKMAAEMLDIFVLTDDETYTEDGDKIREEVKVGIRKTDKVENQDWYEVGDRLDAIRFALKIAQKGDTILIPGMGSEPTRNVGGEEIEWDEREVVRRELENYLSR